MGRSRQAWVTSIQPGVKQAMALMSLVEVGSALRDVIGRACNSHQVEAGPREVRRRTPASLGHSGRRAAVCEGIVAGATQAALSAEVCGLTSAPQNLFRV